jgi:Xaa-Pro dipeptidase
MFPDAEYAQRWCRAQEVMRRADLDALLITEPFNYHYFSGATPSFSYARCNIMVIPRDRNPVIIAHEFVEASTRRETWVTDIRLYDNLIEGHVPELIRVFQDLALGDGRIGAELGYEQRLGLSYNDFQAVTHTLANVTFTDASSLLWELRMIKSTAEIQCARKACQITSEAFHVCFESIVTGMTEKEIGDIFTRTIINRGGSHPWCFINSGPYNYEVISGAPTNHQVRKGNMLWIDGGCAYRGYYSDFCRVAVMGTPSEKQKAMYATTLQLTDLCINGIRPGVKASDIAHMCAVELERQGLDLTFRAGRLGHGIGLMLTEPPHIANYDSTVLEPGMIITIEPGFVTDYGVFQAEENVLVTTDGFEILSTAPTELTRIASK